MPKMTRRDFLEVGASACVLGAAGCAAKSPIQFQDGLPLVDLHVHPDHGTIDAIVELSRELGVKFGMVEHAGTRENIYPRVLSNDAELLDWTRSLEGKGVYKGVQAEWTDWSACFSKKALATLDYVLTDTMTFPGPGGRRMKLWEKESVIDDDPERFMDAYVDWHIQILTQQPIDMLANVSWIPGKFTDRYEDLWTETRVSKVLQAFITAEVAMEISSSFILPRLSFLRKAKEAGIKFCFGSNGRYPNMGKLEYSLNVSRELGITQKDLWSPGADGPKAAKSD
jgi:histidinol phosphatase-like PHP family hydrolase